MIKHDVVLSFFGSLETGVIRSRYGGVFGAEPPLHHQTPLSWQNPETSFFVDRLDVFQDSGIVILRQVV